VEPSPSSAVEVAPGVYLPEAALSFSFSKSSGPGGQNVNKVNTRATLTVSMQALGEALPGYAMRRLDVVAGRYLTQQGLQLSAEDSRSQHANRRACMERLRETLVEALRRPRVRKPTKPSAGSVRRRLDAKKRRGKIKQNRRGKGKD